MLVLPASEVEALLDLDQLVDAVERAMVELSAGRVSMPSRVAANVVERHALLGAMPALLPSARALITKLVSVFPENRDQPTHQALICCFDPDTGTPLAVMDGTYVTAARTAAGSTLATRLLARADAGAVAIIGTGVQARAHARALARLNGTRVIRVTGQSWPKVDALVEELNAGGVPAEAAASIKEAVASADVVCAATHAAHPVVLRRWLQPGTHVNSVGYNTTGDGEVDTATVRDALVVVESRAAVLAAPPSGAVELRRALEEGVITPDAMIEIGELSAGRGQGRVSDDQLTLYKSVGVAVQDAAAAALILVAAREQGAGTQVRL